MPFMVVCPMKKVAEEEEKETMLCSSDLLYQGGEDKLCESWLIARGNWLWHLGHQLIMTEVIDPRSN